MTALSLWKGLLKREGQTNGSAQELSPKRVRGDKKRKAEQIYWLRSIDSNG